MWGRHSWLSLSGKQIFAQVSQAKRTQRPRRQHVSVDFFSRLSQVIQFPGAVLSVLAALIVLGLVFGAGVLVGQRAERMKIAGDPQRQDASKQALHSPIDKVPLTFYSSLTGAKKNSGSKTKSLVVVPAAMPGSEHQDHVVTPDWMTALHQGPALQGEWTLQVEAFPVLPEAQALAKQLRRRGLHPEVSQGRLVGGGQWFVVRLGRFSAQKGAKAAQKWLQTQGVSAWVRQIK